MNKTPVVVTTKHRGVFFGYLTNGDKLPSEITLERARMCVYWSSALKGVLGLASIGPDSDCRISIAVPKLTLWDVTSVIECSSEAVVKWEGAPWK